MKIESVGRERVEGGSLGAVTKVSGQLTNRYTKPVRSVWLGSRIYACPNGSAPQAQCHFVAEGPGYVYFGTPIRTGLTVPLHEAVEVDIPDVTGVLRSYVKVVDVDLDE